MNLFGYDFMAEYIICGLAGIVLLLFIFDIIQFVKISGLKKRIFDLTEGSEGSLEDKIAEKFAQITEIREAQDKNSRDIDMIFRNSFWFSAEIEFSSCERISILFKFNIFSQKIKNNSSHSA